MVYLGSSFLLFSVYLEPKWEKWNLESVKIPKSARKTNLPAWKVPWCCRVAWDPWDGLRVADEEQISFTTLSPWAVVTICLHLLTWDHPAAGKGTPVKKSQGDKTTDYRMLKSPQRFFGPFSIPWAFLWAQWRTHRLPLPTKHCDLFPLFSSLISLFLAKSRALTPTLRLLACFFLFFFF